MSFVKNPILLPLQKLVGISPTPQPVVLDDTNISLTMPLVPDITRRSRASGPTGGWFEGVLENVHSAADDERSSITPYTAGVDAVAPYPTSVGDEFDLWLIGVAGQQSVQAPRLTIATLSMGIPTHAQGFGRDDAGAPLIVSPAIQVARFDSVVASSANNDAMVTEAGNTYIPLNLRIPRGSRLTFDSTASAAATFQILMIIGLFPAGLGQDCAS